MSETTETNDPTVDEACFGDPDHRAIEPSEVDPVVVERAAGIFRAMGDTARLRLLERLSVGEYCVTELAELSGEGLSTISQRLRTLRSEGLVRRRRAGKHVYYALADDHIATLINNALEHASEGRR